MSGHDGGMSGRDSVQIPDDRDFGAFRAQCESERGWSLTYSKGGVGVWVQLLEPERALHKIKVSPPARHSLVRDETSAPTLASPGPRRDPSAPASPRDWSSQRLGGGAGTPRGPGGRRDPGAMLHLGPGGRRRGPHSERELGG